MYLNEALKSLGVTGLSEFQEAEDSDCEEACVEELAALHARCYFCKLLLQLQGTHTNIQLKLSQANAMLAQANAVSFNSNSFPASSQTSTHAYIST